MDKLALRVISFDEFGESAILSGIGREIRMSMLDGAPLEEKGPIGITYVIVTESVDGLGPQTIGERGFISETEAKKYCTDSRMTARPILMFASAKAAKEFNSDRAKQEILGKLTAAQRLILGFPA